MEIESGTVADADAVADRWVDLATEQRQYGSHVDPERNRRSIREETARHAVSGTLYVAREEDIVGFVLFGVEDSTAASAVETGVIENLYVDPDFRNQGVGSELLAQAEAELVERGVDVVSLQAMAANEDARRFYRRHGYSPHRVVMEKPIENDNHSKDRG